MSDFAQYIGMQYDPIKFNCWHLVQLIQQEQFGRALPNFDIDGKDLRTVAKTFHNAAERHHWQRVNQPSHGCCVLMRRATLPIHIGIWLNIDAGGILHNLDGIGVVFQQPQALLGLSIEGYYDHA